MSNKAGTVGIARSLALAPPKIILTSCIPAASLGAEKAPLYAGAIVFGAFAFVIAREEELKDHGFGVPITTCAFVILDGVV